jgi:23S rRNA maturation-related 3'-5' exoribonuclease YhaM
MMYESVESLVACIDEPNRSGCSRMLSEHRALFATVQGSTHNHQAWPGGYLDHVVEVMNIANVLYEQFSALRPLPFSRSDLLLVVFLHDIEKPWKYELGDDGQLHHKAALQGKAAHQQFRMEMLARYGIALTAEHENGLRYAEGELTDYTNQQRRMGPLAAMAHMCDVASARLWFDHPAAVDDPWTGAHRAATSARVG